MRTKDKWWLGIILGSGLVSTIPTIWYVRSYLPQARVHALCMDHPEQMLEGEVLEERYSNVLHLGGLFSPDYSTNSYTVSLKTVTKGAAIINVNSESNNFGYGRGQDLVNLEMLVKQGDYLKVKAYSCSPTFYQALASEVQVQQPKDY